MSEQAVENLGDAEIKKQLDLHHLSRVIEARIFVSAEPVSAKELLAYLDSPEQLDPIIEMISNRYTAASGVELSTLDNRFFAFRTAADLAQDLIIESTVKKPLSRAAMEVLAIIAYHQPITRSEIEEIRGISLSRGTVDILLELGWIKPRGRRRTPGRPLTWGTSTAFLDHFGLTNLSELPGVEELKSSGLLRKGQMIGAISEQFTSDDEEDHFDEQDNSLLAAGLLDDEWAQEDG